MRLRWLTAPWWVIALVAGTLFGVSVGVFSWLQDVGSGPGAIVGGLVGGGFFGLVMGPWVARMNERARAETGLDDPAEMAQAVRAAGRGPVPADSRVRAAAHRLAVHRLDELLGMRRANLALFGVGSPLYLLAAVFWSPWWVLAAVLFAGLLVWTLILPGRMERRIEVLGEPVNVD